MARFAGRLHRPAGVLWDGLHIQRRDCPNCSSIDIQIAFAIEELSDDDPIIAALTKAEDDTDTDDTEHQPCSFGSFPTSISN
jgi:hypothetical protein